MDDNFSDRRCGLTRADIAAKFIRVGGNL